MHWMFVVPINLGPYHFPFLCALKGRWEWNARHTYARAPKYAHRYTRRTNPSSTRVVATSTHGLALYTHRSMCADATTFTFRSRKVRVAPSLRAWWLATRVGTRVDDNQPLIHARAGPIHARIHVCGRNHFHFPRSRKVRVAPSLRARRLATRVILMRETWTIIAGN